jgi:single-stranded-DNA-specific exonuclease
MPRPLLRPHDDDSVLINQLSEAFDILPIVARLLMARGIRDVAAAKRFFQPEASQFHDPFLLKDMALASARVVQAITTKEPVCIYGDYDVDGAVSTALLLEFFRELGSPASFYIPNRLTEGYSLNVPALEKIKLMGATLIITVDNGIMANQEAKAARELGLDLVITDHHQVGEALPEAVAVVNPQRRDCAYPFKGIAGAGVAFKLMTAVRSKLREAGYFVTRTEPNLGAYLDLLALATVCDVVPLKDENRYFVSAGLKRLAVTKREGLKALLRVSGVDPAQKCDASDLGFRLGPRVNACGRIDDASLGVRLLISQDSAEAFELATHLDTLNLERRAIEKSHTEKAMAMVTANPSYNDSAGLVLYQDDWHVGVVGIVASRITEAFRRPAFLLARAENGDWKGSGRSVMGVSLIAALRECAPLLKKYGGHEAAAGVTLAHDKLGAFAQAFAEAVARQRSLHDLLRYELMADAELTLAQIDMSLAKDISRLGPFGAGNRAPIFCTETAGVMTKKIVGTEHLKLELAAPKGPLGAIAFGKAKDYENIGEKTGLVFGIDVNRYRNDEQVQLLVKDFF